MTNSVSRTELIEKINKSFVFEPDNGKGVSFLHRINKNPYGGTYSIATPEDILSFVEADRKRILERVREPLADAIRFNDNCGDNIDKWKMVNELACRIEQTISIIDSIGGNK